MPPRFFELHPRLSRGLLALAVAVLLLAVVEGTLRLSGFEYHLYPEDLEFGQPDPVLLRKAFRPDPDLFWVKPGYPEVVERLERERPPLLLLGDSVTHLGHYDEALAAWAREHRGRAPAYGNLGVAGWSSYQGRVQVERDVARIRPAVITVYFGWNDHWIGFGFEDAEAASWQRFGASRWGNLRLVQLVLKARVALGGTPRRVPLDDFRANLEAIVAEARRVEAVPVLLTAPDAHRRGAEPEYLRGRWLEDLSELVPLHDRYVDAVREVAAGTGAPLCDLAAEVDSLAEDERDALFLSDGIHLTPAGDAFVGRAVATCLDRFELWPRILEPGS